MLYTYLYTCIPKYTGIHVYHAYLTYMQSTLCKMLGWMNHKLESRLLEELSTTSDRQKCISFYSNGRKWRQTKEPLDEDERGERKSWLKTRHSKNEDHGIQSHHFMANKREKRINSDRFYFGGSKITADNDCSHEIKRCLLLGRKSYDKPKQHIKKQRHHFANKGLHIQSYSFFSCHVWMWVGP